MKDFLKKHGLVTAVVLLAAVFLALGLNLSALLGGGLVGLGSISFNAIPTSLRVPFFAAEFDSSRAAGGPAILAYRALIIGQKTSAGAATANTLVRVTSEAQAITQGGRGSMLHRQARAWFKNNKQTELWLGVLADNGAGVAATKTLTVTGPATATGTLHLYVGGDYCPVAVTSGDAQNAIAAAIEAALDLLLDLPVIASVSTNVVTLTARNAGTIGQDLNVRLNYQFGEETPAGVSVAIANVTSGVTNPSLTSLIAAMGDVWFNVIAHPYTDATSLTSLETELSSRFGPMRMIDGMAITSAVGSQSTLSSLGDTRNSPHSVILAQPGETPITPPSEFASAAAAVIAASAAADPARPHQTLPLAHVKPPVDADLFSFAERDLLLHDGIGTSKVGAGGVVQLERTITTYKTNGAGADDTAYLDSTTGFTIAYLRYSFRTRFQNAFPRHKLGSDGARVAPGQAIVTPKIAKAEACAWFRQMEDLGLVENFEQFKTDLVVEKNVSDPNRLDFLLSPDVINGLVIGAAKFQFQL